MSKIPKNVTFPGNVTSKRTNFENPSQFNSNLEASPTPLPDANFDPFQDLKNHMDQNSLKIENKLIASENRMTAEIARSSKDIRRELANQRLEYTSEINILKSLIMNNSARIQALQGVKSRPTPEPVIQAPAMENNILQPAVKMPNHPPIPDTNLLPRPTSINGIQPQDID